VLALVKPGLPTTAYGGRGLRITEGPDRRTMADGVAFWLADADRKRRGAFRPSRQCLDLNLAQSNILFFANCNGSDTQQWQIK
jgi:hypothetical protein